MELFSIRIQRTFQLVSTSICVDIYIYNKNPRCITAAGKLLDV